jgi:hypothetical protein
MRGLKSRHKKAKYYHPNTMMCYRKRLDGKFEHCSRKRLFRKDEWVVSGLTTGFIRIEDYKGPM